MTRLLFGFFLLAVSWTVSADDIALYKVELIVFENLDPAALQAEDWPDQPGTPPLDKAVELSSITAMIPPAPGGDSAAKPVAPPTPPVKAEPAAPATVPAPAPAPAPAWRWLNDSELSLNGLIKKLNASQRYRPLLHIGWIQPLDSSDQGTAVHIYDGMSMMKRAGAAPQAPAAATLQSPAGAAPEPQETATQAADSVTAPPSTADTAHRLDGTFTLRRGRFLHVDADFGYRESEPAAQPAAGSETAGLEPVQAQAVSRYVRMTQSRRIRNDELHYLDHPLFGVLFAVSPYQQDPANIP